MLHDWAAIILAGIVSFVGGLFYLGIKRVLARKDDLEKRVHKLERRLDWAGIPAYGEELEERND